MSGPDRDDDDRPPTVEERSGAEARREAIEGGDDPIAELLVASVRPRELDARAHERILAEALGDAIEVDEPEPTAAERAPAEALRRALEGDAESAAGPLAALARALRNAYRPAALDDLTGERILRRGLGAQTHRARRVTMLLTVSAAVAVAAAVFGVFFRQPPDPGGPESASATMLPGMVEARSTSELFGRDDFPAVGGTTERIDRIRSSREADLRNNRFVAWGVP